MSKKLNKAQTEPCTIHNVSVRYFYNGICTIDSCNKCGSNDIKTCTSDWLRMEKMNRKECNNCNHHWLVNAH